MANLPMINLKEGIDSQPSAKMLILPRKDPKILINNRKTLMNQSLNLDSKLTKPILTK